MEQSQYLIDTNAVIDYLGKKLPITGMMFMNNIIDAVPNVSVITKIEVLGFSAPDEHYQLLTDFMGDATVLDLTNNIVDERIGIRKRHKTKLPDAIIAATALAHGYSLITNNEKDFANIKGLKIINPHKS
jgi:predicted nucleic acid-binding protein